VGANVKAIDFLKPGLKMPADDRFHHAQARFKDRDHVRRDRRSGLQTIA
jgi:hypothetical protein